MAVQEKCGGTIFNSEQVLMPSNCILLDDGKSSLTGVQPKQLYASGDDVALKARKPYTITKQRERWTEEEHKKFLEALKLHGRAWRRIEEHIGTKTAVQIRSHAQKFFTKVVRESSSNSNSMKSTEIPPPRPKRKPMHPYPRKLVHPYTKGIPISEQPERCTLLIPSISEHEDRSPSSVLSAVASDAMESAISNPSNGCSSPGSSATGPDHIGLLVGEQENGSPSTTSSVEKDRSPSPVLLSAGSRQQNKPSMELETSFKDLDGNKDPSSVEVPTISLKLFGKTVLVTDSHRPSSPIVGNIQQRHKSSSLTDSENQQENLEADLRKQAQTSPRNTMQGFFSGGQCQSGWNPWPCGVPPVYYCMQLKQEDSNTAEAYSPIPWWALYGNLSCPPVHSDNMHSGQTPFDSCIQASDDKGSINKEGSWTGSHTGSISEVGLADRNCDVVDSQTVTDPVDFACLKASENLAFNRFGDLEKDPVTVLCLKASENSAFSSRHAGSRDSGKGFVPYKRCVAERDIQQRQISIDNRETQRVRLCL